MSIKTIPLPTPPADGESHHVATTVTPFRQGQFVDGKEVDTKLFDFPQFTYAEGWRGLWVHFLDCLLFTRRRALRTTVEVWLRKTGASVTMDTAQVTLERNKYAK